MKKFSLNGTPKQIGFQHGEEFKIQIREISQIRKELVFNFLKKIVCHLI